MKKLIITAAPNKNSFTHIISEKLLLKYPNSEVIDLYDEKYKLDFLTFENKRAMPEDTKVKLIQEKITLSGEIIFVFPVWWGNMPAIMKNMFDSVFISGFAFEYGPEGKKELLTDKMGSIIATCDAPADIYLENSDWTGINLKEYFKKALFGFCGIKMGNFKLFGELRTKTDKEKENFLNSL